MFIRPDLAAAPQGTVIMDWLGHFLGDAIPKGYFAARVPAGKHVFVSWALNTSAIAADLAPGRVYFIEVTAEVVPFGARVEMYAVTRGGPRWKRVRRWLAESQPYVVGLSEGQAYVESRRDAVQERIRRGLERLAEGDAGEAAERRLSEDDGVLDLDELRGAGSAVN